MPRVCVPVDEVATGAVEGDEPTAARERNVATLGGLGRGRHLEQRRRVRGVQDPHDVARRKQKQPATGSVPCGTDAEGVETCRPVLLVTGERVGLSGGELEASRLAIRGVDPVAPSLDLAWEIEDRASLSFWDALIIAGARESDATHLLSEGPSHGQQICGITVMNPFRVDPTEWLRGPA